MNHRNTTSKRVYSLLLCLLLLFSGTALAADSVEVVGTYGQTEARTMLQMVNDFRTGSETWYFKEEGSEEKVYVTGLKALTYDYTLEKVAMQRAAEISVKFDHIRPNGTKCFSAYPSGKYTSVGENIAFGFDTAASMMGLDPIKDPRMPDGWNYGFLETNESYDSQGHRRTLLSDDFTAIGIGHIVVNGVHYWAQEFGSPAVDTTPTVPNDSLAHVTVSTVPAEEPKPSLSLSFDDFTLTSSSYKQTITLTADWDLTYKSSDSKLKVSGNKITIPANYAGKATISVTGTDSKYEILPTTFTITVHPTKPSKPSISSLKVKKRKVTAKWKRDSRVSGYQVQYSMDKSFQTGVTSKKITKNSTVSLTTPALKKGKTYYFRLRSYKTYGGKALNSSWSSVKKIKVK